MKPIELETIIAELNLLNAGQATQELIINNVMLYNDLIEAYGEGQTKNLYLTYQLNVQIFKQLTDLRKLANKSDNTSEPDGFEKLMQTINPKIEKR